MSDEGLRYEDLTKKSFAVFGDRAKYDKLVKSIGGVWNAKLKPNPGWSVNKEYTEKLIELVKNPDGYVMPVKIKKKYTRKEKPVESKVSNEDDNENDNENENENADDDDIDLKVVTSKPDDSSQHEYGFALSPQDHTLSGTCNITPLEHESKELQLDHKSDKMSTGEDVKVSEVKVEDVKVGEVKVDEVKVEDVKGALTLSHKSDKMPKLKDLTLTNDIIEKPVLETKKLRAVGNKKNKTLTETVKPNIVKEVTQNNALTSDEEEIVSNSHIDSNKEVNTDDDDKDELSTDDKDELSTDDKDELSTDDKEELSTDEENIKELNPPSKHSNSTSKHSNSTSKHSNSTSKHSNSTSKHSNSTSTSKQYSDHKIALEEQHPKKKSLKLSVRKLESPRKRIINKSRELFNNYLQSSDDDEHKVEESNNEIYEKYINLFKEYTAFAANPKEFNKKSYRSDEISDESESGSEFDDNSTNVSDSDQSTDTATESSSSDSESEVQNRKYSKKAVEPLVTGNKHKKAVEPPVTVNKHKKVVEPPVTGNKHKKAVEDAVQNKHKKVTEPVVAENKHKTSNKKK